MKLPPESDQLSLYEPELPVATYPPLGFWGMSDYELGNGDIFGLYWPIGREEHEPIVCETWHDSRQIAPYFSSVKRFLASVDDDDEFERGYVNREVTAESDPDSPFANFHSAKALLQQSQVEQAIDRLENATKVLPEYTDALALLCTQYRRVGRQADAIQAGHRMMMSPPCFGHASAQILGWLSRQEHPPESLRDDPLWQSLPKLKWKFGGEKLNDDYLVLRAAIDRYLELGRTIEALTLMQTYGEWMTRETVSFHERYDFTQSAFVKWQVEVSENRLGRSRVAGRS